MYKVHTTTVNFSADGVYNWHGVNRFTGAHVDTVDRYVSPRLSVKHVDTRSTEDPPDWRRNIAKGWNATGPLIGSRLRSENSPFTLFRAQKGSSGNYDYTEDRTWCGNIGVLTDVPNYVDSGQLADAQNRATQYFIKKAISAQRTVQALVSAGELGETARGISHAGRRLMDGLLTLVQAAYAIKRGHFARHGVTAATKRAWGKKTLKLFPDMWLSYSLEVRPLLGDIDSWCKTLATDRSYLSPRVPVSGFADKMGPVMRSRGTGSFFGMTASYDTVGWSYASSRIFGAVKATGPDIPRFRYLGVSWSDVIPAAYELVPYSFVVDYFTNLGDVLEALCFNRSSVAWVSQTDRWEAFQEVRNLSPPNTGHDTYQAYSLQGKEELRLTNVNRRSLDQVPVLGLSFRIPGVRQWVTTAALAASLSKLHS